MNTKWYLLLCIFHTWQLCGMEPTVQESNDNNENTTTIHSLKEICSVNIANYLFKKKLTSAQVNQAVLPDECIDLIKNAVSEQALKETILEPNRNVPSNFQAIDVANKYLWLYSPDNDKCYNLFNSQTKETISATSFIRGRPRFFTSPFLCTITVKSTQIVFINLEETQRKIIELAMPFQLSISHPKNIKSFFLSNDAHHLIVKYRIPKANSDCFNKFNLLNPSLNLIPGSQPQSFYQVYSLTFIQNQTIKGTFCFSFCGGKYSYITNLTNSRFLISHSDLHKKEYINLSYLIIDCQLKKIIKEWHSEARSMGSADFSIDSTKKLVAFQASADSSEYLQISSLNAIPNSNGLLPALAILKHKWPGIVQSMAFLPDSSQIITFANAGFYIWHWPSKSYLLKSTDLYWCSYIFKSTPDYYETRGSKDKKRVLYRIPIIALLKSEEIKKAIDPSHKDAITCSKLSSFINTLPNNTDFIYAQHKPVSPKASAFAISHVPLLPYAALQTEDKLD